MKSFLALLNSYYWKSIQERSSLKGLLSQGDWIESIIHFCDYAFERQGSPIVYKESAQGAFRRNHPWLVSRERWSEDIELRLFDDFKEMCRDRQIKNFNEKVNPIAPSGDGLVSLIYFAWYETKGESIAQWAKTSLLNDRVTVAFDSLKKIRGIGNKIASFYLRDISILSGVRGETLRNTHLLQPIDVWTRRAARILSGETAASDKRCAEFLVEFEDRLGLDRGSSNIAFWALGSQIAEEETVFAKFLSAIKEQRTEGAKNLLKDKVGEAREWLGFLEDVYRGL